MNTIINIHTIQELTLNAFNKHVTGHDSDMDILISSFNQPGVTRDEETYCDFCWQWNELHAKFIFYDNPSNVALSFPKEFITPFPSVWILQWEDYIKEKLKFLNCSAHQLNFKIITDEVDKLTSLFNIIPKDTQEGRNLYNVFGQILPSPPLSDSSPDVYIHSIQHVICKLSLLHYFKHQHENTENDLATILKCYFATFSEKNKNLFKTFFFYSGISANKTTQQKVKYFNSKKNTDFYHMVSENKTALVNALNQVAGFSDAMYSDNIKKLFLEMLIKKECEYLASSLPKKTPQKTTKIKI